MIWLFSAVKEFEVSYHNMGIQLYMIGFPFMVT